MIARFCVLAMASVLLSAQEPAGKEAALGGSLAAEVQNHTAAIVDSTVHDYLQSLAKQVSGLLSGGKLSWEFTMVRDDVGGSTHEPLSVPGGHVFVPASLILAADNEAELAGMLAHSMAHATQRRAQVAKSSTIPLVFIGGWVDTGLADSDDRASVPVGYLEIQRRNELDADRVAANTMDAAGYDPAALIQYVRRTQRALAAESGKYSALPSREERIGALETAVVNLPSHSGRSSGEFKAIQDRVRELTKSPPKQPPSLHRKNGQ